MPCVLSVNFHQQLFFYKNIKPKRYLAKLNKVDLSQLTIFTAFWTMRIKYVTEGRQLSEQLDFSLPSFHHLKDVCIYYIWMLEDIDK